jgi:2'-5' RNA ligase
MRRSNRPPVSPPLPRRAVVWFPPAELLGDVEAFRAEHDPRTRAIPGHVTLVFPFASALTSVQVAAHVRRVAARWPLLPVEMAGSDAFEARWLYLRVTRGREALAELHDRLHRGVLAPFLRHDFPYVPHLTIGVAEDVDACNAALERAAMQLRQPIAATVHALCVVTLRSDGRIERGNEIPLGAA